MTKPKKKPNPVYTLRAQIREARPTYYIAQYDGQGATDETMVRLDCMIVETSPKFRQHVGEAIDVTLTSERKLWLGPDDQDARPYFLSLALRKDRRSLTIYSPIDAIWALPGFIASGSITHVEIDFYEPKRGVADILDLGFSRIEDMWALDARTGKLPLQASKTE
jgi:hypothetical protein